MGVSETSAHHIESENAKPTIIILNVSTVLSAWSEKPQASNEIRPTRCPSGLMVVSKRLFYFMKKSVGPRSV